MTKISVTEETKRLHIAIDQLGEGKTRVLQALQACAEGRCSCPMNQSARLQAVEVTSSADGVGITLTPKDGATVDRQVIAKCLDYTLGKLGSGS